jgi:hypothetical protein
VFGNTNVPDFGPMLATAALNDPENYAVGRWSDGLLRGRVVYLSGGSMADLMVRGRRGGSVVTTASIPSGESGTFYTDVSCGVGPGLPSLEITSAPGVDERGEYAVWLGAGFYAVDAGGNRIPGFGLMLVGVGGWTTANHLDNAGCTPQALAGYYAATLRPNTFLLHIGANQTAAEAQSLNAGDPSVYRANVAAMIDRHTQAALAAGAQGPVRWILVNPFPLGWSDLNAQTRMVALSQVAAADPQNRGVVDLSVLAARRNGAQSWYTTDGAHPTPDGAAYLAGLIWSQIVGAL